METLLRTLLMLCLELVGLTILASVLMFLGAYHYFDGFSSVSAGEAFLFAILALSIAAIGLIGYVVMRVGHLKIRNGQLYEAATRDALTRLFNRAAFKDNAERMIASVGRRRSDPAALSMLIVDADHFKRINDRLGHGVGDRALTAIATTLSGGVRHYDLVGRLGGEEFIVLLKDAGPVEAMIVAERLRANVNRLVVGPASSPVRLSVSVGGVCFDRPVAFDLAYRQADLNLYKAKKAGRNRSEISDLSSGNAVPPRLGRLPGPNMASPLPAQRRGLTAHGAPQATGTGLRQA